MTFPAAPAAAKFSGAWPAAAWLVAAWLERHERIDALLETLPRELSGPERARCQHLVFGVIRHFGRLDAALGRLIAHPPRFATRAVLFIAGFELIEASEGPAEAGQTAKIVHHAVEQTKTLTSPAEARLVNAVVRKLAGSLVAPPPAKLADAAVLAEYYSHPEWLVRRWLVHFGPESTRLLLDWNQRPAPVYARWRVPGTPPPAWLKASAWPGFVEVPSGRWGEIKPLLTGGQIYLQDPGTRLAVGLLAPRAGETVLDACAAPGGKSLLITDTMRDGGGRVAPAATSKGKDRGEGAPAPGLAPVAAPTLASVAETSERGGGTPPTAEEVAATTGKLVAVDLPGPRIDRLKENLARVQGVEVALVQGDLLQGGAGLFKEHGLPAEYAAVLLDAPCTNSGVMRHRVDVKWRLQAGDFRKHAGQQLALLHATARLVAPGGRLVYSTCSIDEEENEDVVASFLHDTRGRFELEQKVVSLPWVDGHDGAGAFLLRRLG